SAFRSSPRRPDLDRHARAWSGLRRDRERHLQDPAPVGRRCAVWIDVLAQHHLAVKPAVLDLPLPVVARVLRPAALAGDDQSTRRFSTGLTVPRLARVETWPAGPVSCCASAGRSWPSGWP